MKKKVITPSFGGIIEKQSIEKIHTGSRKKLMRLIDRSQGKSACAAHYPAGIIFNFTRAA